MRYLLSKRVLFLYNHIVIANDGKGQVRNGLSFLNISKRCKK